MEWSTAADQIMVLTPILMVGVRVVVPGGRGSFVRHYRHVIDLAAGFGADNWSGDERGEILDTAGG